MSLPKPSPGLVIRYSYLWHSEHLEGREEGRKDRPCAIITAINRDEHSTHVLVLPITHSEPSPQTHAVEIPQNIKRNLGLDADRSWVVLSECNEFVWPGPDLRPVSHSDKSSVAYGRLPSGIFDIIREQFLELVNTRSYSRVSR